MSSKRRKPVTKPTKKIADQRRIRYGSGSAPRAIRDSRSVRFGSGSAPAALRK